ncbi:MAG: hypothetical protein NTZ72_13965 [Afipia sp.]|nr:hypothetical protein [Afipia sp.]
MKIPTPEDLSPALREKQKQRREIAATINIKKHEATIIAARIANKKENPGNVDSNRMKRLLNQETDEDVLPDREQLNKLRQELETLDSALRAIDGSILNEKITASVLVCDNVRQEHTRLAKQFATKLLALHSAHEEYANFVEAVDDTGTRTGSLGVIHPTFLGSPRDHSGCYHFALRDFADAGHISRTDIPESVA